MAGLCWPPGPEAEHEQRTSIDGGVREMSALPLSLCDPVLFSPDPTQVSVVMDPDH